MDTKSKINLSHLILSAVKILYQKPFHISEIHCFTLIRYDILTFSSILQERLFLKKKGLHPHKKYAVHFLYSLSISSMVKPIVFMIKHIHHPDFRPTALRFLSVSSTALATASTVDTD